MTPVFVNSASVRVLERLMLAGGGWRMIDLKVRFGFLDHPRLGPVLIDTGYSHRVKSGKERSLALKAYTALTKPRLELEATEFLASRGIAPSDIRTIIITHVHADHVSALKDFPNAQVHADGDAIRKFGSASHLANVFDGVFTELLPDDLSERLVPFDGADKVNLPNSLGAGFDIFGDRSAVCVPFPGHAPGHCGIWFGLADKPFLYATDVQWMKRAVTDGAIPWLTSAIVSENRQAMRDSVNRLRIYHEAGGSFLLCHDPETSEYDDRAAM